MTKCRTTHFGKTDLRQQVKQSMIGVGRSLILRENIKNKTSHAACICSQATCSKKILFSKTFRKIKHDCYRKRSERFNNDFKAGYFGRRTLRRAKPVDINI